MRYTAQPQRRLPKESKTLPIIGKGDDEGKYFRCWHCGFVCNVDRDELGGPDSRHGVTATAYTQVDQYGNTAYHCVGAHGDNRTMCEARGGTWSSTKYEHEVSSGCPLCGTRNWRGDY